MTTRKLSPIKENSGEKKTFKTKYSVKTSQTDPNSLLKKKRRVLTSSDYNRRTKKAPTIDGHGNKTRLPLGRKSRKKNKRKSRKKKKRKSRKKKKRKSRQNRNVFGKGNKGSNYTTESWDDLVRAIKNSRTNYIIRQWIDLEDPIAPRKAGCETYYDKNRVYKVEISKTEEDNLLFEFIDDFIKPDEMLAKCKLQGEQILTQDEYEFATKTGKYYHETGYNQFMTIKNSRGYEIFWASEH